MELLNCKEVQRLRRVKQLGFSELVFPGANHNRFAHSVGVLHVAKKFLDRIDRFTGKPLDPVQRTFLLAACLLHDIGHGPFSHAFEKVTGLNHESFTGRIINDSSTEVNRVLTARDPDLPQYLARLFFAADPDASDLPYDLPPYLEQVVSSQLDADRCDYLLRDSHATGTGYGRFDLNWLLNNLETDGVRLFLSSKATTVAESYLFSRFHMYRSVYFHKTTRSAEIMLGHAFRRFKQLLESGGSATPPGVPHHLLSAFGGRMSLDSYLNLDDGTIGEFLKVCASSTDPILSGLASGLLDRRLYKAIDVTDAEPSAIGEFITEVTIALGSDARSPYRFAVDSPTDVPYKPYDPEADKPAMQIYIKDSFGAMREIGEISPTARALRDRYRLTRYYFPAELHPTINAIAAAKLPKRKS